MRQTPTNQVRSSEGGLAGVAALIIFIAIVLVGAITAAVILDVTGSLEQQAAQTGQDASNQISSTIQILERSGITPDSDPDNLEEVQFVVSVAPGTPDVNLADMLITVTGPNERTDLTEADSDDGDGDFEVTPIVPDDDAEATVIEGSQERFQISIDNGELEGDDFGANERYQLVFTSGEGGQAFQEIRVPSTLTEDSTIRL